jgi:signal transduction histidine kinase
MRRRAAPQSGTRLTLRALFSGIRGRLLRSYLLLMLMTMAVITTIALLGLEWYYRSAMADVLRTRGAADQQYFRRIEAGVDLDLAGQDLASELGAGAPYRVQVYGTGGRLVGDSSLPAPPGPTAPVEPPADVAEVLQGGESRETVARTADGDRALHLALPLQGEQGMRGVLRFSTSLAAVDRLLLQVGLVAGALTLVLLLLTLGVGLVLARTVVRPVAELTRVAEAMAAGELGRRARVHFPDEVGRLAETLNRMAHGLGEIDRLRSDFLRAVSHDLRTPLAAIKAWVVTLQDAGGDPVELRQGLLTIEESVDHLARLVEDLLMAARLQSGADLTLRPQPVDALRTVQAVCQALLPRARAAGVELGWSGPRDLPPVCFDPDRLAQVVANLVGNGLKFTPRHGRVTVTLAAGPGHVLLTVADTGRGIAPEDLPRVTQRFFRGQGAADVPGTGLGLAIVAELVRRSGGELAITSQPGQGTTVTVRLPLTGRDRQCP